MISSSFQRLCRSGVALLVVAGLWIDAFAQQYQGERRPVPALSPSQKSSVADYSQWIADLDDNQFDTRERAQQKLEQAGQDALDAVAQAVREGSLESSTRALNILLSWSEGDKNAKLRIAALERIAKLGQFPKESSQALEVLADAREAVALEQIVKMGGSYCQDIRTATGGMQPPRLQVVIDTHWKGGVEGLQVLKDVRRLSTLSFHSAALGSEIREVIEGLPQLYWVELYGMSFPPEVVAQMKQQLPQHVNFDVRKSALLGVRGQKQQGARVAQVEPDSAAEKAGLKPADLIVEMEGKEVKDFQQLTRLIAEREAGETAALTILRPVGRGRETEKMRVYVTFDRWGEKKRDSSGDNLILRSDFDRR